MPDKIFDAHTHFFDKEFAPEVSKQYGAEKGDLEDYKNFDDLEKRLVHPNIKGFKCYHIFADKEITWNCTIDEYLPESAWQLANEKKMCITPHMVKDKALADEENLKYICAMAQKYKDATLILAHAARSFAAWTAIESVEN